MSRCPLPSYPPRVWAWAAVPRPVRTHIAMNADRKRRIDSPTVVSVTDLQTTQCITKGRGEGNERARVAWRRITAEDQWLAILHFTSAVIVTTVSGGAGRCRE